MRPTLLQPEEIETYLEQGHWTRETLVDRYRCHARMYPSRIAFQDSSETYSWSDIDSVTDRVAANLIDWELPRDSVALVQMPSSCREIILRIAFKKAGLIGVFVPVQWRQREIRYVMERTDPALVVCSLPPTDDGWREELYGICRDPGITSEVDPARSRICVDSGPCPPSDWMGWQDLVRLPSDGYTMKEIATRQFAWDEVSLVTASSGTSGYAKLCEWPEGAQLCVGRAIASRMRIQAEDRIGIFAPMSGAAGLVVWLVAAGVPCSFTFPHGYAAATLLDAVRRFRLTVATTVPVILSRLTEASLESYDLGSLRALRVGTAATDCAVARRFEQRTGCRVVVASGSMEVPGFGHSGVDEPLETRLDGSVGLPLGGGQLRIDDDEGRALPAGRIGELKVRAPFASSGYWKDPAGTEAAWTNGWYASGDLGTLDVNGRLWLKGRMKEVINRSGLKILPQEVEQEISGHPDVLDCAVVSAPDTEYGEVPWSFIQLRPGVSMDIEALADYLRARGLPRYKIPVRFIEVNELPRVSDNKVDKAALRTIAASEAPG